MTSDLTQPFVDRFPALSNSRIADSHVLRKRTLFSHRFDFYSLAVVLKLQAISRPHAQPASNLARHGNLPLAGQLGLFLHGHTALPYFIISLLTFLSSCFLFKTSETMRGVPNT